jgi:hypothetical protein
MFARHRHAGSTMRTNRLPTLVSILAPLALLPGLASANCYSIYDAKNRLAFQSTVAPVDLSTRISESMRARFPGGFLIMIPDESDCREFRTGPTTSPRFDAGGSPGTGPKPEQLLEASPLLRGTGSSSSSTREPARSGSSNNVKRP